MHLEAYKFFPPTPSPPWPKPNPCLNNSNKLLTGLPLSLLAIPYTVLHLVARIIVLNTNLIVFSCCFPSIQNRLKKKYLFGCTGSLLQHAGSLSVACGIQFPDQGSNPGPLIGSVESQPHFHWEVPRTVFDTWQMATNHLLNEQITVTLLLKPSKPSPLPSGYRSAFLHKL